MVAREGDYVLRARYDGGLCLSLTRGERRVGIGSCTRGPVSTFSPATLFAFDPRAPQAFAVADQVATVAFGTPARVGRRVPTVAARGFRARFVIAPRPEHDGLLRFFDASGALVGAHQLQPARFGALTPSPSQVVYRRGGAQVPPASTLKTPT